MRIVVNVDDGDGEEEADPTIDPRELPVFDYEPPPLDQMLRASVADLGLLGLFNLLFFSGAFVSFLRYDVR